MGGKITELILVRAAFWDAVIISFLIFFFLRIPFLVHRPWLIIVCGIIISLVIEWYALGTGRWVYNEYMPVIPLLRTGLSPTVQLGIIAYCVMRSMRLLPDNFLKNDSISG